MNHKDSEDQICSTGKGLKMKRTGIVITPAAGTYTPSFVVTLGQSEFYAHDPANLDDIMIVRNFMRALERTKEESPLRAYYISMLGAAKMVERGMASKKKRRNARLEDAERKRSEKETHVSEKERIWEKAKAGFELLLTGGIFFALFSFAASLHSVEPLLSGSGHSYGAIASTIGGLLIGSSLRARIELRRTIRASRIYHSETSHAWEVYNREMKQEYNQAINTVNIAWRQMTGRHAPDAKIAEMIVKAIMREANDYARINSVGEEEIGILTEVFGPTALKRRFRALLSRNAAVVAKQ